MLLLPTSHEIAYLTKISLNESHVLENMNLKITDESSVILLQSSFSNSFLCLANIFMKCYAVSNPT